MYANKITLLPANVFSSLGLCSYLFVFWEALVFFTRWYFFSFSWPFAFNCRTTVFDNHWLFWSLKLRHYTLFDLFMLLDMKAFNVFVTITFLYCLSPLLILAVRFSYFIVVLRRHILSKRMKQLAKMAWKLRTKEFVCKYGNVSRWLFLWSAYHLSKLKIGVRVFNVNFNSLMSSILILGACDSIQICRSHKWLNIGRFFLQTN